MAETNYSEVGKEQRLRKLAVLDFNYTPTSVILKELALEDLRETRQKLYQMRQEPIYKEAAKELREQWDKDMISLQSTSQLRRHISKGCTTAINRLNQVLADPNTPVREFVNAARLIAMMDGRFMGVGGHGGDDDHPEDLAEALRKKMEATTKKEDKVN